MWNITNKKAPKKDTTVLIFNDVYYDIIDSNEILKKPEMYKFWHELPGAPISNSEILRNRVKNVKERIDALPIH